MKYYVILRDNRNEFMFLSEDNDRDKDFNKAKLFSEISIKEFNIPIMESISEFGELLCTDFPEKVAISEEKIGTLLGKPKTVYYRNDF